MVLHVDIKAALDGQRAGQLRRRAAHDAHAGRALHDRFAGSGIAAVFEHQHALTHLGAPGTSARLGERHHARAGFNQRTGACGCAERQLRFVRRVHREPGLGERDRQRERMAALLDLGDRLRGGAVVKDEPGRPCDRVRLRVVEVGLAHGDGVRRRHRRRCRDRAVEPHAAARRIERQQRPVARLLPSAAAVRAPDRGSA